MLHTLDGSHFWCFHIIQDFYKIICDPPLTIKSYAGDFEHGHPVLIQLPHIRLIWQLLKHIFKTRHSGDLIHRDSYYSKQLFALQIYQMKW